MPDGPTCISNIESIDNRYFLMNDDCLSEMFRNTWNFVSLSDKGKKNPFQRD